MNLGNRGWVHSVLLAALAGALVLGLAACKPRPAAGKLRHPASTAEQIEPNGKAAAESLTAARKPVDDATLAVNVRAALIAAPGVNATTIDVNASGGVITLNGTAETSTRRDLAGYVALRVEGVNSVRNRIVIISGS
jgi:osmotically-inducible protein OsmY